MVTIIIQKKQKNIFTLFTTKSHKIAQPFYINNKKYRKKHTYTQTKHKKKFFFLFLNLIYAFCTRSDHYKSIIRVLSDDNHFIKVIILQRTISSCNKRVVMQQTKTRCYIISKSAKTFLLCISILERVGGKFRDSTGQHF